MRRVVIVTGVLGGGAALTFAAAAFAATLFPNGHMVTNQNMFWQGKGDFGGPVPVPMPLPIQPGANGTLDVTSIDLAQPVGG